MTAKLQVRNMHGALRVVLAVGDRIEKVYKGDHANLTDAKTAIRKIKENNAMTTNNIAAPVDMTVANTIVAQLGGGRFQAMTGAKMFVGGADFVQFKLPRCGRDRINSIRIELNSLDLYDVIFHRIGRRGLDVTMVNTWASVSADMLAKCISIETGLDTSL